MVKFKMGVAAWLGGVAWVGLVGCGGGSSSTNPAASGGEIVFVANDAGASNIFAGRRLFRANLNGSNRVLISTDAAKQVFGSPAWFPGRGELFYSNLARNDRSGIKTNLRRVGRDGANDREIFIEEAGDASVSPDGRRVAFHQGGTGEIVVADVDGTNPKRLAAGSQPSWSPDGTRLTYIKFDLDPLPDEPDVLARNSNIYVMNADGSNAKRLTPSPNSEMEPRFSPDGRRIVYSSAPPASDDPNAIWVMNADGSNPTRLATSPNAAGVQSPKWMPDGNRIAFIRERTQFQPELAVMNADGSNQRPLFNAPTQVISFDVR